MAKVEIKWSDICKTCHICSMMQGERMVTEAENEVNDSPHALKAAFMVYIIPLIGLFFGYILGKTITNSQAIGILSGIAILFVTFFILHLYDRKMSRSKKFRPEIVQVISRN